MGEQLDWAGTEKRLSFLRSFVRPLSDGQLLPCMFVEPSRSGEQQFRQEGPVRQVLGEFVKTQNVSRNVHGNNFHITSCHMTLLKAPTVECSIYARSPKVQCM